MAVVDALRALRFSSRIQSEDDFGDLPPIGSVRFCVEKAQISDGVVPIICSHDRIGRRGLGKARCYGHVQGQQVADDAAGHRE